MCIFLEKLNCHSRWMITWGDISGETRSVRPSILLNKLNLSEFIHEHSNLNQKLQGENPYYVGFRFFEVWYGHQNPTGKPRISVWICFLGSDTKLVGTWILSKGQHQKIEGITLMKPTSKWQRGVRCHKCKGDL